MHLLLIEDSRRLCDALETGLTRSGYAVDVARDGEAGLRYLRHTPYDAVILDLMLPKVDGLSVLSTIRDEEIDTHVLILTARDAVDDRVHGLRAGADDYLVKPFAFDELLARIEALMRRRYETKNPTIEIGPLTVDTSARTVTRDGARIELSRREYALLEFMAHRRGDVISRHMLEDHLYGERDFPMSNAIDRTVCSLRKKIERSDHAPLLVTRRGLGYVLDEPTT